MLRSIAVVIGAVVLVASAGPVDARSQQETGMQRATVMAESASAFLRTLTAEQRARISRPLDDDTARTDWSNLPTVLYQRGGLSLAELSPVQRVAFHDLMSASLSSQGYGKATTIMWIEDILRGEEEERLKTRVLSPEQRTRVERLIQSRQSDGYWVRMFGDPATKRWGWMFSGHHLAANFTVAEGRIGFTPLFVGVEPQTVLTGRYAGWRMLSHEIDYGFAMLRSMDQAQRKAAKVADVITDDLFTGKGRKDSLNTQVGISASRFNKKQQEMLWRLLREYVGSAADEAAERQLDAIRRDGLGHLHFAWWGSMDDPSKRFMYRLHGPSILIEYVREARGGEPANHVHAIVRNPKNDYGEDWLGKHYREQPHP